jgi:hypothetical protein
MLIYKKIRINKYIFDGFDFKMSINDKQMR